MIIKVRVIPTSGRNEIISRIGSVLRMKIKNKKVDDDAANAMMKTFLADFFAVREDQIIIVKGAKGKEKTVEVRDKSEEELRKIMEFTGHKNPLFGAGFLCFSFIPVNLGTNAKSAAENLISDWVWSVLSFLFPPLQNTPHRYRVRGVFVQKPKLFEQVGQAAAVGLLFHLGQYIRQRQAVEVFAVAQAHGNGFFLRFFGADYQRIRHALHMRFADFQPQFFGADIQLRAQAGGARPAARICAATSLA